MQAIIMHADRKQAGGTAEEYVHVEGMAAGKDEDKPIDPRK